MGWWTEERMALATRLWVEHGRSATEIAEALGAGATRNGVLGKLHRLKLVGDGNPNKGQVGKGVKRGPKVADGVRATRSQGRGSKGQPNAAGIAKRSVAQAKERARMVERPAELPADVAALKGDAWSPLPGRVPVPLTDLAARGACRWPIGEVGEPGFGFCGAATAGEHVYCTTHTRRAHAATAPARDTRRRVVDAHSYVFGARG